MRRNFKILGTNARPRYIIDGIEVTPAWFMASMYDEYEAMPSNAFINLSAAQLAQLAATSVELGGHDAAKVYTGNTKFSRLVQAVKNSEAISTKAV